MGLHVRIGCLLQMQACHVAVRKGLNVDMRKLSEVSMQLNSMWEGEAKQAFIMAVQDDIRRLSELITALEKFTTSTDTARGNYDTCEKNVSSIISSLRV